MGWGVWVAALPCQEDEQEGVKNHTALIRLIRAEKAEVLGEGGANVPRLLALLVDAYKTEMMDEECCKGFGELAVLFGEQRLEKLAQGFNEKQRKKLMRIVRDAQK